tara:strand:+ start:7071 stop:8396 length:1326 start_codon:yes stop_codon:yes gene_type:complete
MNRFKISLKVILSISLIFFFTGGVQGQFLKKLGKRAEEAAQRTVERRVEKETQEKTDQALDSILEPGSGSEKKPQKPKEKEIDTGVEVNTTKGNDSGIENTPTSISVYSKFDFVPGDELMFFDDFSNDFTGDFPSKWDTNGSGEIVMADGSSEKWFEIKAGSTYIPLAPELPEDYTIEFDILTLGLDNDTSSQAFLELSLTENKSYDWYKSGDNSVSATLPFCQYIDANIRVSNKINTETLINNLIETDMRAVVLEQPHISVAVNGQRFRLWVNERKYIDIPRLVSQGALLKYLRFNPEGLADGKDRIFINNLKIAKGGVDLRRKLLAEGSVSTNGILFDSGSANIQPSSMGIIRQISQVLKEENGMSIMIIGHTDGDGSGDANLSLSQKRAEAVKNALVKVYGIADNRLQTQGKGESEPIAENTTPDGKAQNRRVVFKKI